MRNNITKESRLHTHTLKKQMQQTEVDKENTESQ